MFFNELSLTPMAPDIADGRKRVMEFILTMKAAASRGIQGVLRLPNSFYSQSIAPNYSWHNCLNDAEIELEARRYLKSLATKASFINDVPYLHELLPAMDCFWNGQSSLGLKAAHIADGLALSFRSSNKWDVHSVECNIHELEEDGEILPRHVIVRHASSSTHLDAHAKWIQLRNQQEVGDGKDLWQLREIFFPSLVWCAAAEHQMKEIPANSLTSIIRGLTQLNAYCVTWQSGAFNPESIGCDISPESESTLQMYGAERTFLCPNGQMRTFNWKAKVGRSRIYFRLHYS